jgi:hypothetical protein
VVTLEETGIGLVVIILVVVRVRRPVVEVAVERSVDLAVGEHPSDEQVASDPSEIVVEAFEFLVDAVEVAPVGEPSDRRQVVVGLRAHLSGDAEVAAEFRLGGGDCSVGSPPDQTEAVGVEFGRVTDAGDRRHRVAEDALVGADGRVVGRSEPLDFAVGAPDLGRQSAVGNRGLGLLVRLVVGGGLRFRLGHSGLGGRLGGRRPRGCLGVGDVRIAGRQTAGQTERCPGRQQCPTCQVHGRVKGGSR